MPHIKLPTGIPGIIGGLLYRPEVAGPIAELSELMLRGPNTLTPGERELIAAYVSTRNECHFCQSSHRAAAAHHLDQNYDLVDAVRCNPENAPVSPKLKALLAIAGKVQESGKNVTEADVARARAEGATDMEIHDTVLIAAMFAMANRYVDGLATFTPEDDRIYHRMGAMMANKGYAMPGKLQLWLMSIVMRFKKDRNAARSHSPA
ncbi:MAG TPA: peroxidase-related enzyme [Bryobacteraceae bacterium]|nr:peroxidase-related enzyme [Bryobacteraceae bacterium]